MSDTEIIGRAVAHLSGLDSGKIAENNLATDDKASLGACYSDLGQRDIFFAERTDTPEKIRIEALRMKRNGGLSAVIVDYLQLMRSGEKSESRRVEVGYISRNLKLLALELDCPVIALSQLNRASTMTASKVPSMAELRESGDIEQDADLIVLMYTPPDEPELSDSFEATGLKLVRFLIEKNRNGRAGAAVDTAFDGSKMRFMRVSEALT
jgi:replicative DNA helicase